MIYVASSWRNERQPAVVTALRHAGLEVYDFRNPAPGDHGFAWSEIDPKWRKWSASEYRQALKNARATSGYLSDYGAMLQASTCLLVLPCGRSAHIEAGWCKGAGKRLVILLDEHPEPELMYRMADAICLTLEEAVEAVKEAERG